MSFETAVRQAKDNGLKAACLADMTTDEALAIWGNTMQKTTIDYRGTALRNLLIVRTFWAAFIAKRHDEEAR